VTRLESFLSSVEETGNDLQKISPPRTKTMHYAFILLLPVVLSQSLLMMQHDYSSQHDVEHDLETVRRQLGYRPRNFVRVSARTTDGFPIAIQTYPLEGGSRRRRNRANRCLLSSGTEDGGNSLAAKSPGTPFPTLHWLTHPEIRRAIGGLERKGCAKVIEAEI